MSTILNTTSHIIILIEISIKFKLVQHKIKIEFILIHFKHVKSIFREWHDVFIYFSVFVIARTNHFFFSIYPNIRYKLQITKKLFCIFGETKTKQVIGCTITLIVLNVYIYLAHNILLNLLSFWIIVVVLLIIGM